jgi:hypothetical protein
MEFEELGELIFDELKPKLEANQGLSIFCKREVQI